MNKYPASIWDGIKARCKAGGIQQIANPEYYGCSTTFEGVKDFVSWISEQPGFGHRDENGRRYHVDKDLFYPGNKIYGREFCCLIPARINTLMLDCGSKKHTGIYFQKNICKWQARVQSFKGNRVHLGLFESPQQAHMAWRKAKSSTVIDAAEWYLSIPGFDVRVYESLMRQAHLLGEGKE